MSAKQPTISTGPATSWMQAGACRELWWLPWIDNPQRVALDEVRLMRQVCAGCPVLDTCAGFVVQRRVTGGFWAGRWRSFPHVGRDRRLAMATGSSEVA